MIERLDRWLCLQAWRFSRLPWCQGITLLLVWSFIIGMFVWTVTVALQAHFELWGIAG